MNKREPSLTVKQLQESLVKPVMWNVIRGLTGFYVVRFSFLTTVPNLSTMGLLNIADYTSYSRDQLVDVVKDIDPDANIIFS